MKKTIALILALVMVLAALTGCGGDEGKTSESALVGMGLEDILNSIYEQTAPEFGVMTMPVDLADPDAVPYMTGLTADQASMVKEAIVSESMMGSQAYSLVLVRVNNTADINTVAEAMKNGIDTRKWICVEADDLAVAASGDVVMLIMVSSEYASAITADSVVAAFKQTAGGSLSVEL